MVIKIRKFMQTRYIKSDIICYMKNDDKKLSYSDAILKLRTKLNVSQEELAKIMNVSFVSVNRWENGHFEPTKLQKEKLKEMFNKYNIF